MKLKKLISALCAALMFTGCAESIGEIIENDANIGKNAPAVNGTIGDINAINEEAAKTETEFESEEDKAEKAAKERLDKLNKRADELLSKMTAEEKAGQVILARMPSSPADEMSAYQYGGYTLYGNDFKNSDPEGISALTAEISEAAKISPFFAVDEEGGTVVRVSAYTQYRDEPFSSPQLLYIFQSFQSVGEGTRQQNFFPFHQLGFVTLGVRPDAPGDALVDDFRFLHAHQVFEILFKVCHSI